MYADEITFEIKGTEAGVTQFCRDVLRYLIRFELVLKEFKIYPLDDGAEEDVSTCKLKVALEYSDMSKEEKTKEFREILEKRPGITSVQIVEDTE